MKAPISFEEIKDYKGKCYQLETTEIATVDQSFQGFNFNYFRNEKSLSSIYSCT